MKKHHNQDRGVSVKLNKTMYELVKKLALNERRTITAVLTAALRMYELESILQGKAEAEKRDNL